MWRARPEQLALEWLAALAALAAQAAQAGQVGQES
jgi:hypothetical protein